jgi:hypothetical protein
MAMWQIYGSSGCGVAVRSSVGQYQRAAKFGVPSSQLDFQKVTYHCDLESSAEIYRDFSRGPIPLPGPDLWREVLELGFHKRSCFDYENEWRAALYQDSRPGVAGIHVPFDLDNLINEVYIGPRAEEFLFEAVSSIMDKFRLQKPLTRSSLLSEPRTKTAVPTRPPVQA